MQIYNCTLERTLTGQLALRLGLRMVKGLSKSSGEQLIAARKLALFADIGDLVLGAQQDIDIVKAMPIPEGQPLLRRPTEGEDIISDYGHLGLTLGRHPLALLRKHLAQCAFLTSEALRTLPHKTPARAAGLVITRQRPGTTTGVTFLTLEDEFGTINVVVWSDLAERQRALVLGSRLLGVTGTVEKADGVLHLIAETLEEHSSLLGRLVTTSRDFC